VDLKATSSSSTFNTGCHFVKALPLNNLPPNIAAKFTSLSAATLST